MTESSRSPAAAPLALLLLLILGIGGVLLLLGPSRSNPDGAEAGVLPGGSARPPADPAAEDLVSAPVREEVPAAPARVDTEAPAVELRPRRTDRILEPRVVPGPSLRVHVQTRRKQPVSRGTVVLKLATRVREGKLRDKLDERSAILASVPLDASGWAEFAELPTMHNQQQVEVAVIAPDLLHGTETNEVDGESITLVPGDNTLELKLREGIELSGRVRDNGGADHAGLWIAAIPDDFPPVSSVEDLKVHLSIREGLRSGRPLIWNSTHTDVQGNFSLSLPSKERVRLIALDPDWWLTDSEWRGGGRSMDMGLAPRPHLMIRPFGLPLEGSELEASMPGVRGQLTWRMGVELSDGAEAAYEELAETEEVLFRGVDRIDLAIDQESAADVDWQGLEQLGQLDFEMLFSGELYASGLSGPLEIDWLEVLALKESREYIAEVGPGASETPEEAVFRVLYPDGQDAPGDYVVRSKLCEGPLVVGFDGHGVRPAFYGWGHFRLAPGAIAEQEGWDDLWAADYQGWMCVGRTEGQAGSVTHAFVDRGTRLRVQPPDDHVGPYAVRLSVRDKSGWRRIDETPPGQQPFDWARLPYGAWYVERLDADGAVIDNLLVQLNRGEPAELRGDGKLEPWRGDVARVSEDVESAE